MTRNLNVEWQSDQSVEGGTLRTRIGQNPTILINHGFLLKCVAVPHRFDEDNTPVLGRLLPVV
jgi:hypothetical protein